MFCGLPQKWRGRRGPRGRRNQRDEPDLVRLSMGSYYLWEIVVGSYQGTRRLGRQHDPFYSNTRDYEITSTRDYETTRKYENEEAWEATTMI